MKILLVVVLLLPSWAFAAHDRATFVTAFHAFATKRNPYIPSEEARRLGELTWAVSEGRWKIARRLAAKQAIESGNFKLAAWIPEAWSPKLMYPRYDCLGSHLNLLVQEAGKLGTGPENDYLYSDEMQLFLDRLAADPSHATWMVAHAYVRKAKKVGVDRASHWWQTGKDWFLNKKEYQEDEYIKSLLSVERSFDSLVPGEPKPARKIKRRRK